MISKIFPAVSLTTLGNDMQKYLQKAIGLGATDARVITVDQILIDERVRAKCFVPACGSLGKNGHCPPHAPDLDFIRNLVTRYQFALFYRLLVPSDESAGPEFKTKKVGLKAAMLNWKISSRVEAEAFYDGYYLAMGFAGGPCDPYLCQGKDCTLLSGKGCRNPYISRPSMEAYGMNVFLMAANAGWDVYPIGGSLSPSDIPHGSRFGLVLVH
jgi:predicted metal-binding protein